MYSYMLSGAPLTITKRQKPPLHQKLDERNVLGAPVSQRRILGHNEEINHVICSNR